MNKSQEHLLSLLRLTIHEEVPDFYSLSAINSEELFELALEQGVYSYLYSTIKKYHEELKLDEIVVRRWQAITLYSAVRQVSMVHEIKKILSLFECNNILAISLKGLILKQLYPSPELRTMGDIDLLINESDMKKSIELLTTYGYIASNLNNPRYMHIRMNKFESCTIELHRTLWHPKYMKKINDQLWLNHIWQNKRLVKMFGLQFFALSLEDELVNLIVHLAKHIMGYGARIRQLCDFTLFIKTYGELIDLEYVEQTIKSMDLFNFYEYLLRNCQLYLGLEIPDCSKSSRIDQTASLIDLIYASTNCPQAKGLLKQYRAIISENNFVYAFLIRFIKKTKILKKSFLVVKRAIDYFLVNRARNKSLRSFGLYLKY